MSNTGSLFKSNVKDAREGKLDLVDLGEVAMDLVREPRFLDEKDKSNPSMIAAAEALITVKAHRDLLNAMSGSKEVNLNEMREGQRVRAEVARKLGEKLVK